MQKPRGKRLCHIVQGMCHIVHLTFVRDIHSFYSPDSAVFYRFFDYLCPMIHLIVSFLPLAVCAFWSVAIALNLWEQGNRAAHRQLLLWAVTATLLYTGHFVFFNRMTSVIPVSDTIYVVCNLLVYPFYLHYITVLTRGTVSSRQRWLTVLPPMTIGIIVAIVYAMMSDDESRQFVDTYLYKSSIVGLSGLAMVQAVVHRLAKVLFAIGLLVVLFVGIRRIRRYNSLIDSIYADNDDKRLYGITTILILMVLTAVLSFVVNAVGRFVFLSSEIPFAVLACCCRRLTTNGYTYSRDLHWQNWLSNWAPTAPCSQSW